jgi:hypothetical protein
MFELILKDNEGIVYSIRSQRLSKMLYNMIKFINHKYQINR